MSLIHYNCRLHNATQGRLKPLKYIDRRASPLIIKPADYRVAVLRWRVPSSSMPLFFFDQTEAVHSVTLSHVASGTDYTTALTYSPHVQGSTAAAGYIWNVSQYLVMVNAALANSFADLFAAHGGATLEPPYYTFDGPSSIFAMWVPATVIGSISIYNTWAVARLFGEVGIQENAGFPGTGPKQFETVPVNTFTDQVDIGGVTWLRLDQDRTTYSIWNDVASVSFQVMGIPVVQEYESANSEGIGGNTTSVLPDFDLSDVSRRTAGALQHFSSDPRFYEMTDSAPVTSVYVNGFWTSSNGRRTPIELREGESFDMKLEFRSKSLGVA